MVARDHGRRQRRVHAGPRRRGVRRPAFRSGCRRRRADLAVVRRHWSDSSTRPQFRLPDHVGADLRRLRPARDADGLSGRGVRGRAVVLRAVPADHAAMAQVLPGVGREHRTGGEGRGRSSGLGEGARPRGDVRVLPRPGRGLGLPVPDRDCGWPGGAAGREWPHGLTVRGHRRRARRRGDRRSLRTRRAAHHRHRRRRRDALLPRRPVQRDHVPGRGQRLQSRLELHPPIPARRDGELRSARPRRRLRGRDADARARGRARASRRASSGRAST